MSLFSMVLDVVIAASDLIIHTSQTPMSSLALFPLAKFQRACIDVVSLGNGGFRRRRQGEFLQLGYLYR